ncbi:MAG: type II toxin-antitoxin system HicB family antitoxin [Chlorobi bacterium]|nr:type II toxin-antitoxin system HicB family antitoxin [Chlorobiota bacterium]
MKYKGYTGKVVYDDDAKLFHGEVLDLKDVITFQGKSVEELEQAFRDSIDDYIEFCEERKEKPDKPFSGKFVVNISPSVHHQLYLKAIQSGKSLNRWISDTLTNQIVHNQPDLK